MNHKDLDAWKQAIELAVETYRTTSTFPKEEIYGLTAQIRRAAVSIPSNLSEGAGRESTKELLRFLTISLGSIAELETQLILAKRLDYMKNDCLFDRLNRVRALMLGLRNSLSKR